MHTPVEADFAVDLKFSQTIFPFPQKKRSSRKNQTWRASRGNYAQNIRIRIHSVAGIMRRAKNPELDSRISGAGGESV